MNRPRTSKPYWEMTTAQLRQATRDLDQEFALERLARPAPPEEVAKLAMARRKRGRPPTGRGAKPISVTVERTLLGRCDTLARQQGITRAQLIARGIRAVLAAAGA